MEIKDLGKTIHVEVIEERKGYDGGSPTNNTYAGIGYEVEEFSFGDFQRTGRIFAWAGNNADGSHSQVSSPDLDDYLRRWDVPWVELFEDEGILD